MTSVAQMPLIISPVALSDHGSRLNLCPDRSVDGRGRIKELTHQMARISVDDAEARHIGCPSWCDRHTPASRSFARCWLTAALQRPRELRLVDAAVCKSQRSAG